MCQGPGYQGFLKLKVKADESLEGDRDYTVDITKIEVDYLSGSTDPVVTYADDTSFTVSVPRAVQSSLSATDVTVTVGETGESTLSVLTDIPDGLLGVQFYVETPDGITLEEVSAIEEAFEGQPHVAWSYNSSKEHYDVSVMTVDNSPMCKSESPVDFLKLKLKANDSALPVSCNVLLNGFVLTYKDYKGDLADCYPDDVTVNVLVNSKIATGIERFTEDEDGFIYDITGKRVGQHLKKGVYIKNGKKFVVK
jgi:hypothetical protein